MSESWLSNVLPRDQQRGGSGSAGMSNLAIDADNPYYNYRICKHVISGSLLDNPSHLWSGVSPTGEAAGLERHLKDQMCSDIDFTDLLLVLSESDYGQAMSNNSSDWLQRSSRLLLDAISEYFEKTEVSTRFPGRRVGLRVIKDGSTEMKGSLLGLQEGEFATGILPNLYTGPVSGSKPVIAVYISLEGVFDGFEEVGELYSDQVMFTLGSHWLDNCALPQLQQAALIRIVRLNDGRVVQMLNPDMQDKYRLVLANEDGVDHAKLYQEDGSLLASIIMETLEGSDGGLRSIIPGMDDEAISMASFGSAEVVAPTLVDSELMALQSRSVLLQKIHFKGFMEGYDLYLGANGGVGTRVSPRLATIEVRKSGVTLLAHDSDVAVPAGPVPSGQRVELVGDQIITVADERFEYRDLKGLGPKGWPYVGEVRQAPVSRVLVFGERYQIGRSTSCRVTLPDVPSNTNIVWKRGMEEGTVIKAKSGDIHKSQFYTDSIMVASEHASINLDGDVPVFEGTARHCFSYVRRGDELIPLYPTKAAMGSTATPLVGGDELMVGNNSFRVVFSAKELALSPGIVPLAPAEGVAEDATDTVAARGLGELGAAPAPIHVEHVGFDSIVGIPPEDDSGEVEKEEEKTSGSMPADPPAVDLDQTVESEPKEEPESLEAEVAGDLEQTVESEPKEEPESLEAEVAGDLEQTVDDPKEALDPAQPGPSGVDLSETVEWSAEVVEPESSGAPSSPEDLPAVEEELSAEAQEPLLPIIEWESDVVEEESVSEGPPPVSTEPSPEMSLPVAAPPAPPTPSIDSSSAPPLAESSTEVNKPGSGSVVCVDDETAQFELGRKVKLVQIGWMVQGALTLGNHTDADLILPENRIEPGQTFDPVDYASFKIRGKKAKMKVLSQKEVLIDNAPSANGEDLSLDGLLVEIIRRDDDGEEDFRVGMRMVTDSGLPNPRARLMEIDPGEPLAAAIFTKGLPQGAPRTLEMGGVSMTLILSGEIVTVSDYLDSYRVSGGYLPFFVDAEGGGKFVTAPEDGAPFELAVGARMVLGCCLYQIKA